MRKIQTLEARLATAERAAVLIREKGWDARVWHGGDHVRVYVERQGVKMGFVQVKPGGWVRFSLQGDDWYHRELDGVQLKLPPWSD